MAGVWGMVEEKWRQLYLKNNKKYIKNSHDSTPGRQTIQLKKLGKGPKQTCLQGGHTEGPETYKRMLSITSHQRDGN